MKLNFLHKMGIFQLAMLVFRGVFGAILLGLTMGSLGNPLNHHKTGIGVYPLLANPENLVL